MVRALASISPISTSGTPSLTRGAPENIRSDLSARTQQEEFTEVPFGRLTHTNFFRCEKVVSCAHVICSLRSGLQFIDCKGDRSSKRLTAGLGKLSGPDIF